MGAGSGRNQFENTLALQKKIHHSRCLFNRESLLSGLNFRFSESGTLKGEFECGGEYQGYDGMVHGGVIAAIIDASMAQCLMGHGIVAYTADLSVRYRRPVMVDSPAVVRTSLSHSRSGIIYKMESMIRQQSTPVVSAKGTFYSAEKSLSKNM
ncbi:MAG: PaaI family thioesterase [Chitinispirillaceae bacterium]